ncbi:MAG: class I SAM-dependent methyltransferase [Desulfobacterales bacterium]|nr:class I SAM-dependent methyltransferase [Desulfobacterales bacterium]
MGTQKQQLILKEETFQCPLCQSKDVVIYFKDNHRTYLNCGFCNLVFVPQTYWLTPEQEKAVYDLHVNDSQDQGYVKFLSRLADPLIKRIEPGKKGLDFGCGPGPVLAEMLEEAGHQVDLFDMYYHNSPAVFSNQYDFICATEVAEHLQEPGKTFETLFSILKQDGWMGIMTKQVIDLEAFSRWHYIRDMTHICFYSRPTFEYLAQRFKAKLEFVGSDVIFLQKNRS